MKDADNFYLQIRDQIKHEDNLCNNRMTWLISLQSFLFGAYGFTVGVKISDQITVSRIAFCIMGIMSAVATLFALRAAKYSINRLVEIWFYSRHYNKEIDAFPPIIGTYSEDRKRGTRLGEFPLMLFPLSCCAVWIFLLCSIIYLM